MLTACTCSEQPESLLVQAFLQLVLSTCFATNSKYNPILRLFLIYKTLFALVYPMTCKNILLPFQSSVRLEITGKETDEVDVMAKILPIRSEQYGLKLMVMVLYGSITKMKRIDKSKHDSTFFSLYWQYSGTYPERKNI